MLSAKEYRKLYYLKNKDIVDAKNRAWSLKNPDGVRKISHRYNRSPKGIYSIIKNNCYKKKRYFELKQSDFLKWYDSQRKVCCYCGVAEDDLPPSFQKVGVSRTGIINRLTIDRKDNSLGYIVANIALCCAQCNRIKGDFLSFDEMIEVGKIIRTKCQDEYKS